MYFKYGSHQHPDGEVNLVSMTKRTHFSQRAKSTHKTVRMVLEGVLCLSTQSAIEDAIDEIYEAYKYHGKDAALYMDDGSKTSHAIDSSNTIDGTRVISVDFPTGAPGEFATGRTFRVILEANIIALEDQILWYSDSITTVGTPGIRFAIIRNRKMPPVVQILSAHNSQHMMQRGNAIGWDGWVAAPIPVYPYFEELDKRMLTHSTPRKIWKNDWHEYHNSWSYSFQLPIPLTSPLRPAVR